MEFITGLKQQEEAELEDLLKAEEGTTIILEGAVHSVRDMGEIAFVILRKKKV
jgi:nondiscriminating aspartyl-tRNA synthetase